MKFHSISPSLKDAEDIFLYDLSLPTKDEDTIFMKQHVPTWNEAIADENHFSAIANHTLTSKTAVLLFYIFPSDLH
jgi:hypothetical protein